MVPSFTRHRWLILLGDIGFILLATQLAPFFRLGEFLNIFVRNTGAFVFTTLWLILMFYIFDLYNLTRIFRFKDIAIRSLSAVICAYIGSAFFFYSLQHWKFGRGIILIQMILVWVFLTGWRWLFSKVHSRATEKQKVLVIGAGQCGINFCRLLEDSISPYQVAGLIDDDPQKQGKMIGSYQVLGTTEDLKEIACKIKVKTAILAISYNRPQSLIKRLWNTRLKGVTILDMPLVYEQFTRRLPVHHLRDEWLIFSPGFNLLTDYVQQVKRIIDFGVSSLLLIPTMPVMIIAALAIRLDSPGPVFFKQKRVGLGNREFTTWKFRSMRQDAEENGAVWAEKEDARVTRVGKWIRKLRIDELPQLINVFKGDMSLIGPRPERPEFVKKLEEQIPYYSLRHSVRPGITGWAQVSYPYGASVEDSRNKLEYDLYYVKNRSLLFDLKIILRTIGVVFFGEGAR